MAPTEPSLLTEGGSPGAEWKIIYELSWPGLVKVYEVRDCVEGVCELV